MDDNITTEEFAALARCPVGTVRYWRHIGHGPKGFKLGRRVLYARADVLDWIEAERARQLAEA